MEYSKEIENLCLVKNNASRGASPLPIDGNWVQAKDVYQICGLSHGCGKCAPQQGTCKLTLNVKNGIIEEALVECLGCSGMTHSAAMAGEILPGKTILEALNTDLVCDAINDAMKQIFLQLVYGRSQSAFSSNGLPIGTCLEDLGKNKSSQVATIYSNKIKGTRYLNLAEGYITKLALDENDEIIGYEYINTNKLIEDLKNNIDIANILKNHTKTYGRFNDAVKFIDPRKE